MSSEGCSLLLRWHLFCRGDTYVQETNGRAKRAYASSLQHFYKEYMLYKAFFYKELMQYKALLHAFSPFQKASSLNHLVGIKFQHINLGKYIQTMARGAEFIFF